MTYVKYRFIFCVYVIKVHLNANKETENYLKLSNKIIVFETLVTRIIVGNTFQIESFTLRLLYVVPDSNGLKWLIHPLPLPIPLSKFVNLAVALAIPDRREGSKILFALCLLCGLISSMHENTTALSKDSTQSFLMTTTS